MRFDPSLEAFEWNNAPDGTPSPYLLLAFQLDRLLSSAQQCQWTVPDSLNYTTLKDICDTAVNKMNGADGKRPLKVRVVYPPSGDITASAFLIEPLRHDPTEGTRFNPDTDSGARFDPTLSVCVDTAPTSGTGSMKTTNRKPYDDARARVGLPSVGAFCPHESTPDDVILFNASGAIMESSICNVAFYRRRRWLTPPLTVGCIAGVFRRWLLENGHIYEADEHVISLDTIKNNEWVLLFNGVMGCRLGRVYFDRGPSTPKPQITIAL